MTTSTQDRSFSSASSSFARRLDSEWNRLRIARRSIERARRWADGEPNHPLSSIVADIENLDAIVAATQRGAPHDDTILIRLVELAHEDELAGRVIIQRLLPGLISRAASYRDYYEYTDPVELAVPAAWIAIKHLDAAQRRHHIAAILISDAVFQACRRPLRRRSVTEVVRSTSTFADTPALEPGTTALVELANVIREAVGAGLDDHDVELVRHLVSAGSPSTVAHERKVTPRTIRNHRARAVDNIRAAIAVAA